MVTDKQIDDAVLTPTVERCTAVIVGLLREHGRMTGRALAEDHIGISRGDLYYHPVWSEARARLVSDGELSCVGGWGGGWMARSGQRVSVMGREIEIVGALRRLGGSASISELASDLGIDRSSLLKRGCLWSAARRNLMDRGVVVVTREGHRLVEDAFRES